MRVGISVVAAAFALMPFATALAATRFAESREGSVILSDQKCWFGGQGKHAFIPSQKNFPKVGIAGCWEERDGSIFFRWKQSIGADGSRLALDLTERIVSPAAPREATKAAEPDGGCAKVVHTHGFLSRAQFQCDIKSYDQGMLDEAKRCSADIGPTKSKELLKEGMELFDWNESQRGRRKLCADVLSDFPKVLRR